MFALLVASASAFWPFDAFNAKPAGRKMSEDDWDVECKHFMDFLVQMEGYEIAHHHDEELETPEGLIHCIVHDFGGYDDCMDWDEFKAAWAVVNPNEAAPRPFFELMDINGDGCIDESEVTQILVLMGKHCT